MPKPWIPWPDRIKEFAPVVGLHRLEMFYPTIIEAMITKSCELVVFLDADVAAHGPVFARVQQFADVPFIQKIQYLISPRLNDRRNFIDRHGGKHDVRESARLQEELEAPKNVYARGFCNEDTGEAYIVYRFFYVENITTRSEDESRIADRLTINPDKWWSHEGDWEGISMHFKKDPQATLPDEVVFSRHKKPRPRLWKNTNLERGRVLALPALGTHATYNDPVLKKLKASKFNPFNDYYDIAQPHVLYYPESIAQPGDKTYQLTELDPRQKHLWLLFKGRWGDANSPFEKSPRGPLIQKRKHFTLLADRK